jgi:hypothetical protein
MPMTFKDVDAFAKTLPGASLGTKWDAKTWIVGDKGFVWERPLRKSDIERWGDEPLPSGDILGVRTENLDAKDALLSMGLPGFFTIQHFNNYSAFLIELRKARTKDVKTAILEAHRVMAAKAPKPRVAKVTKATSAKRTKRA